MKRFILIIAFLALVMTSSACSKSDDTTESSINENIMEVCEHDLVKTLDEMKNSTISKDSYIYNSDISIVGDISGNSDEINKKIASLVEYSISKISINENEAIARIKMTAPDVYKMMKKIASGMEENNTELLFEQLAKKLNGKTPMQKYEIIVELRNVNEHWYLVPNGELANVFSGGLIEQYSSMGLNIIEGLLEEDAND